MDTGEHRAPRRLFATGLILSIAVLAAGCGRTSGRAPRTYTRSAPRDPLAEARYILEGYVDGRSDRSDEELIPGIVAAAREVDPVKAALLEQGFADIAAATNRAAAAKGVLDEL